MDTAEYREARRKSNSVEEMQEIEERMRDYGEASQYCEDAIRALEMMEEAEHD